MPYDQRTVPADSDVLCERCGYTLNGLPESGNCPECGSPIAESTINDGRTLSEYELSPSARTFWKTTMRVLFDTKRFYRTLESRADTTLAGGFARRNRAMASLLFALCATGHLLWIADIGVYGRRVFTPVQLAALFPLLTILLTALTVIFLDCLTGFAGWLTAVEARFWGMRLPFPTVRRALRFHSANYLPVGCFCCGYIWVQQVFQPMDGVTYLYGLCALVILSALYLFQTYWIAMKALMYANR